MPVVGVGGGTPSVATSTSGRTVKKAPAYQHYARDWLVDSASLSLEEQAAHQRLLDHQWIEGPLSDNPIELARRVGVTVKRFAKLWRAISRFYRRGEDGRLRNELLEEQREAQALYRQEQAERGRLGAQKRWRLP
jgi:uncharacterized protein YdaU (DUF1376 family)